jgi:hypothetical protein
MKFKMITGLLLLPLFCFANPAPFEIEVGQMTLEDFKKKYPSYLKGISELVQMEAYFLAANDTNIDGLEKVVVLFDEKKVVAAVSTVWEKSRFDSLLKMLNEKYRLVKKTIPFVGNKNASFSDGEVMIELEAPHLSHKLELIYITKEFFNFLNKKHEQLIEEKEKKEASLL